MWDVEDVAARVFERRVHAYPRIRRAPTLRLNVGRFGQPEAFLVRRGKVCGVEYRQPFGIAASVSRIPYDPIILQCRFEVVVLRLRDLLQTQHVRARRVDVFGDVRLALIPLSAVFESRFEADVERPDGIFALRPVREQLAVVLGQRSVVAAGGKQRQHRQSRDGRDDDKDGFFHNFSSAFIIQ